MLNIIWLLLMLLAVGFGILNGTIDEVVGAVMAQTKVAVELAINLLGIMAFWLGIMKIAEESGLVERLARLMTPLLHRLFPEVPPNHPAHGAIMMNISANMLGLTNAATPFGLKAMAHLESLNPHPGVASNAMVMFLGINTSSVQIIPATAIAMLVAGGSHEPTVIIITGLLATSVSTLTAVIMAKCLQRLPRFRTPISSPEAILEAES